jgi:glutathione S-transferase
VKLYSAPRAPNPRRVLMFIAEKGLAIPVENVDLNAQQHKTPEFLARNPMARVPVLELDDGRMLAESRAICTYLEGLAPAPNLMGADATERAFIEMADRRIEFFLFAAVANVVRHTHPGLAPLEQPQFPDFGRAQAPKVKAVAQWLDGELSRRPWVAGERYTIADITAFCALEFARGLMKFSPAEEGLQALQAWRDRVAARPAARA